MAIRDNFSEIQLHFDYLEPIYLKPVPNCLVLMGYCRPSRPSVRSFCIHPFVPLRPLLFFRCAYIKS